MKKKVLIWGGVFGLIAPFVGIILGLQVSTVLGNIFAFPLILLVMITGKPFGMWHPSVMLLAIVLSIVLWSFIFSIAQKLFQKKN